MVRYIDPILPHVHFRGEEYQENYLELGFRDAKAVGAVGIIEQPNPNPQLINLSTVADRLKLGEKYKGDIVHRIHIGLTNELTQVTSALLAARDHIHNIYSVKAFWVHSTGNMGILDPDVQKKIWKIAGQMDYRGVFFQHLENEALFFGDFDPKNPITHSIRQNEGSELSQVITQIRNAYDTGFKGIFYAAHVSSPDTIEYLNWEKSRMPFRIVIETTGHHEFLNTDAYEIHGLNVKMNPPLRPPERQKNLLKYVIEGKTDIIACDHAPHSEKAKKEKFMSGIPAIAFLPKRIELLRKLGIKESHLENLLYNTANEIFGFNFPKKYVDVEYNPELWKAYGYNPFSSMDGT